MIVCLSCGVVHEGDNSHHVMTDLSCEGVYIASCDDGEQIEDEASAKP